MISDRRAATSLPAASNGRYRLWIQSTDARMSIYLKSWSFANPHNPLEVVDILITEDANRITAVNKRAFGMSVRIAAIPDLIVMKKKAGRAQDLEDIKALRKLQ